MEPEEGPKTQPDEPGSSGVDVSSLHREIDRLKAALCRCRHEGTCIACQGFEMLRQQAQMVIAAASQPVLMQVAQEAAVKDLMAQMGGMQEKLAEDPQLQELMARVMDRIQDDLGGPAAMQQLLQQMGFSSNFGIPDDHRDIPPDDRIGGTSGN